MIQAVNTGLPKGSCRLNHLTDLKDYTIDDAFMQTGGGGPAAKKALTFLSFRVTILSYVHEYDSGDKRSCKKELAHFCMRLGRPQTQGSSHFALYTLDFTNLSVQNERIPSGCRIARAAPLRSDS